MKFFITNAVVHNQKRFIWPRLVFKEDIFWTHRLVCNICCVSDFISCGPGLYFHLCFCFCYRYYFVGITQRKDTVIIISKIQKPGSLTCTKDSFKSIWNLTTQCEQSKGIVIHSLSYQKEVKTIRFCLGLSLFFFFFFEILEVKEKNITKVPTCYFYEYTNGVVKVVLPCFSLLLLGCCYYMKQNLVKL